MIAKKEVSLDHYFCDICGAPISPVALTEKMSIMRIELTTPLVGDRRETFLCFCPACEAKMCKKGMMSQFEKFDKILDRSKYFFTNEIQRILKDKEEDDSNA